MAAINPAEVFVRHHQDVYRYLVRMTGRRDVADDLAQDVFLGVVRALANGGPVGHERGWIFSTGTAGHRRRSWRLPPTGY